MTLRDRAESLSKLIEMHGIGESEIIALSIYTHSHNLQIRPDAMMRLIGQCELTDHSLYDDGKMHVVLMLDGVEVVCIAETDDQRNEVLAKRTQQNGNQ
jgi:hypothetical protein